MTSQRDTLVDVTAESFRRARARVSPHVYHTPLLTSRLLNQATGYRVFMKAEMFQRTGSYKIRGPLHKFATLTAVQRERGVICSSAGNHAQGVALAARIEGIPAVVVMAKNATPSKIAATRAYGAEVVLHGTIWDEANERALELVDARGMAYIHPFDDIELITGQGTLGLEIFDDLPAIDAAVVPIGGGGLISGVSMALKSLKPSTRIIGVESSGAPGMKRSVEAGRVVTLDQIECVIDGLRVKRVGEVTRSIVSRFVDEIVTLPDDKIFEAVVWLMKYQKLVAEGAAAAPVAALLEGLIRLPAGSNVVCVLSGGNLDLDQLKGMRWN
jgi:threonine dehydratase